MNTFQMFCALSQEEQQAALDTLKFLQDQGATRPDEWEHIVDFFYERSQQHQTGWFRWWED